MERKEGIFLTTAFTVLGGDARQTCLVRQLRAAGYYVSAFRVPEIEDTSPDLTACVLPADVIVLPMPALRGPDNIRASGPALHLGEVLDAALPGTWLCGGMLDLAVTAARRRGLRVFDYAKDEALALQNAELTAEAALPILMERLPRPLAGSRILIAGFGRIGKFLARKLAACGADITVSARKSSDLALAGILGYSCEKTGVWRGGLAGFDAILNPVPSAVFPAARLPEIRQDTVLLELASLPGGFCEAAQARPGYLAARGLPGRYAPDAAAAIIRDAIFRTLSLEGSA